MLFLFLFLVYGVVGIQAVTELLQMSEDVALPISSLVFAQALLWTLQINLLTDQAFFAR